MYIYITCSLSLYRSLSLLHTNLWRRGWEATAARTPSQEGGAAFGVRVESRGRNADRRMRFAAGIQPPALIRIANRHFPSSSFVREVSGIRRPLVHNRDHDKEDLLLCWGLVRNDSVVSLRFLNDREKHQDRARVAQAGVFPEIDWNSGNICTARSASSVFDGSSLTNAVRQRYKTINFTKSSILKRKIVFQ